MRKLQAFASLQVLWWKTFKFRAFFQRKKSNLHNSNQTCFNAAPFIKEDYKSSLLISRHFQPLSCANNGFRVRLCALIKYLFAYFACKWASVVALSGSKEIMNPYLRKTVLMSLSHLSSFLTVNKRQWKHVNRKRGRKWAQLHGRRYLTKQNNVCTEKPQITPLKLK